MLFNKNDNGSQELYELTGTFYASTKYSSIASDVEHATLELAKIVGQEIIRAAEEEYIKESPDMEFLNKVRMPVAVLAVADFSRQNIVSHEDSGSKVKVDDNEKVPFEWMIDRDNMEQKERYYRSVDALCAYLVDSGRDWSGKAPSGDCIISGLEDFEAVYPINGSYYTFYMFRQLLIDVQRRELMKVVGEDDISAAISSPGTPLACAMREFVVLKALVKGVKRWSVAVFPIEVARGFSPSYQGNRETSKATIREIEWFIGKIEEQAAEAMQEILSLADNAKNTYDGFPLIPRNNPREKYFTT